MKMWAKFLCAFEEKKIGIIVVFEFLYFSCFRSIMVAHVCVLNAWVILSSWAPTYFHENFPDAKV